MSVPYLRDAAAAGDTEKLISTWLQGRQDIFAACAGTGFSGLFGFFARRDYFGVRNRGARFVVNRPNKTRGLSLRNNVRGKDEQGSSRCREFTLQVMPPIVADTFLIAAPPPQRDRLNRTRHLPAKGIPLEGCGPSEKRKRLLCSRTNRPANAPTFCGGAER
jgi:hypothetical protein